MERKRIRNRFVTVATLWMGWAICLLVAPHVAAEEPVAATAQSASGVVAADQETASAIGAQIISDGGNAVDAAVASLLALGVVNPFASGLGGGGFCLVRPASGEVTVLDFRERAPGKSTRDMYIVDGKVDFGLMMRGGLAIGVPGEARGLEALHQKYGKLAWADVVRPARLLAQDGFVVGELLPRRLARKGEALEQVPELAAVFKRGDRWVEAGERMTWPALGRSLQALEEQGAAPFYSGPIAKEIVEAANRAGGIFTTADLDHYRVTWRDPLKGTYRGVEIFAMPPPSSGGTTILTTLNILERYDLPTLGENPESLHRIAEALKHGFADRARWLGDADYVHVPVERLVSKAAAASREVRPDGVLALDDYGAAAPPPDDDGTSHLSVIDGDRNMVACTSTINTSFGSLVYAPQWGILLNNEMGDFTAQPGVANNYGLMGTEQNAVAPGKRPLSSMSPTLVVKDGEPLLSVGASGGPTIITGTLLTLIRILDWNWSPARAIAAPRFHHQWLPEVLFAEGLPPSWTDALTARGHAVKARGGYNSVQMVLRLSDGNLVGVSDPRKMGRPVGVVP